MKTYNCPFCLRKISHFQLKKHLRTHNLENLELDYYEIRFKERKKNIELLIFDYKYGFSVGDLIEKYRFSLNEIYHILYFNKIKRRTNSQSKKTKIYKEKVENIFLKKYGVKNPSQNEEIKKKKIKTMLKNYGRINNFQDKNIQEKAENNIDRKRSWESLKNTLIAKYGVDNMSKIPAVAKKISIAQKKKISKMSKEEKRKMTEKARSCIKGYTSKLELRIQEVLNNLKIEYSNNKFLFGYNYDIIFRNKIILEIMGDFWHANPKLYESNDLLNFPKKKRYAKDIWKYDKRKKEIAEKKGYSVIYLWESELNNMNNIDIINYILNL